MSTLSMSEHLHTLADAFDQSFRLPIQLRERKSIPALAIRIGGEPHLLPLDGLSIVSRAPRIVRLPSSPGAQVGVAGIQGGLVGVFSLPALLGYEVAPERIAWLAVTSGEHAVGLGFDVLERQVLVPAQSMMSGTRLHVAGLALLEGETSSRALLDVDSLLRSISTNAG